MINPKRVFAFIAAVAIGISVSISSGIIKSSLVVLGIAALCAFLDEVIKRR